MVAKMSWTQPICEKDWIAQNSTWNEDNTEMTGVKIPVRVTNIDTVETCAWCGDPTIMGIYVREDPTKVEFPAFEDE